MKHLAVVADGRKPHVLEIRAIGKRHLHGEISLLRAGESVSAAMNSFTLECALSIAAFIGGSSSATFVTRSAGYESPQPANKREAHNNRQQAHSPHATSSASANLSDLNDPSPSSDYTFRTSV